ncbi:hypothetical protein KIN20_033798 [Parelaphostrongylus tenuis]|uniref:Uncharacterized protein n=1 Tax=Parelaphostrongylus tenuis TaxID=148309 RepID=A0AAD5R9A3_PARTN|nr:hypothetical protein KIN20_033798 [Parelaphostrongylus tenuis]
MVSLYCNELIFRQQPRVSLSNKSGKERFLSKLVNCSFMSEGSCERRSEVIQGTCLFVSSVTGDGKYCDRRKLSKKSGLSDNELAIAKVYNNDVVMRNIVSFITDINARVKIELSSWRLHYISRTSAWRFKSGGDTLSLTFKTLNAHVSVEVGDVWFALPCTTLYTRREGLTRVSTQPVELMRILYGMAERFTKRIENVIVGGTDFEYQNKGVQNHQLIITADLLRLLNDCFMSTRSISLRQCGFDEGAIKYLISDEFSLPKRIRELKIDSVWFDNDSLIPHFTTLITSSLQAMKLRNFTVSKFGVNLFDRMKKLGVVLDDLHVALNSYSVHGMTMASIRSFLMDLCSVTRNLHIGVSCPWRSNAGCFLFAVRSLLSMKNITELQLLVNPANEKETEDVIYLLHNLGAISSLRKLVCGGWKNYNMSVAFSAGLSRCYFLEELVIRNIFTSFRGEMATILCGIPTVIDSLQLEAIAVTDSEIVDLSKKFHSLRYLSLSKLPRISSSGIFKSLLLLHELKAFHCSVPVNNLVVRFFTNSANLGSLWKISIVSTAGNPDYFAKVLSKYFVRVRCSAHSFKRHWCRIEAEGRRIRLDYSS